MRSRGVEMMSRYKPGGRPTLDGGNPLLRDSYPLIPQGISADLIATIEKFSRFDVDTYATESQRRASIAIAEGRFAKSMVAATASDGAVVLDHEEIPRASSLDELAHLKPAFAGMGTAILDGYSASFEDDCRSVYPGVGALEHVHHAGNSSGIADGAAAVLLASPRAVAAHGWSARARVTATAVAGSEPVIMVTAPGPVTQQCLNRVGMHTSDIDLFEVNEAFAAVVLKFMRDVDVEHERINANGGAIALGHPIEATGAMLLATMLDELERRDLGVGLVTMCTGAGMGTATIVERT